MNGLVYPFVTFPTSEMNELSVSDQAGRAISAMHFADEEIAALPFDRRLPPHTHHPSTEVFSRTSTPEPSSTIQATLNGPDTGSIIEARIRDWRLGARQELDVYAQYEHGWDGYAGGRFSREVLDRASLALERIIAVLSSCLVVPDEVETGPASDGSIDIDTTVGQKRFLLTIYPGEQGLHATREQGGVYRQEVAEFHPSHLDEHLAWLVDPMAVLAP